MIHPLDPWCQTTVIRYFILLPLITFFARFKRSSQRFLSPGMIFHLLDPLTDHYRATLEVIGDLLSPHILCPLLSALKRKACTPRKRPPCSRPSRQAGAAGGAYAGQSEEEGLERTKIKYRSSAIRGSRFQSCLVSCSSTPPPISVSLPTPTVHQPRSLKQYF